MVALEIVGNQTLQVLPQCVLAEKGEIAKIFNRPEVGARQSKAAQQPSVVGDLGQGMVQNCREPVTLVLFQFLRREPLGPFQVSPQIKNGSRCEKITDTKIDRHGSNAGVTRLADT